jgi:hypothetical protein
VLQASCFLIFGGAQGGLYHAPILSCLRCGVPFMGLAHQHQCESREQCAQVIIRPDTGTCPDYGCCCMSRSNSHSHSLHTPAGASQCAPGFYSAKGSLEPCQQCPAGRTTVDNPQLQAFITDCIVKPGFGVINSSAAGLAAFAVNTSNLTAQMQASLLVLECPVGYYGLGGEAGSTCTQCPCGSTTTVTGAASEDACSGKH